MKNKLVWGWAIAELAVAGWVGWQIARATEKPWARTPKRTR